jgi:V8-like Glu-specific endopeptidase
MEPEPSTQLQSLLHNGTSLRDISALEKMFLLSKAVARIDFPNDESGTGILLPDNWLLTNHHVLPTKERAAYASAIFGYERDKENGAIVGGVVLRFAPENGFHTSGDSAEAMGADWTVVKLADTAANRRFGQIILREGITVTRGDDAWIIQHPGLLPKKLADGGVTAVADPTCIRYSIETDHGSSGAPVLNAQSEVIAIHRRGHDSRSNEGIPIQRVIDGLKAASIWDQIEAAGREPTLAGGLPDGSVMLTEYWQNLVHSTSVPGRPALPSGLFVSSRGKAVTAFSSLIDATGKALVVELESAGDLDDFAAAWSQTLDAPLQERVLSRFVLVKSPEAWQELSRRTTSLVLIAHPDLNLHQSDASDRVAAATQHGHSVVVPRLGTPGMGPNDDVIRLPSPKAGAIEQALMKVGFTHLAAQGLGRWGHRRLAGLLRHLQINPSSPVYAHWPDARLLAQAMMLGRWNGRSEGDQQAVAELVGESYESWIAKLRPLLLRPDTPITLKDESWSLLLRDETWEVLAKYITDGDLTVLQSVASRVLGESDPELAVPKNERGMTVRKTTHSDALKKGLAETLALLGSRSDGLVHATRSTCESVPILVVRTLLEGATSERWASLNHHLPLLAEAAPREFLRLVDEALADGPNSPFRSVFAEEGAGFMSDRNYITGLLWALESLAWSDAHLGQVAMILGELALIDPGGRWSNRPGNSLTSIFLPWHYQTTASLSQRLGVVRALLRDMPEIGWNLVLSLLPKVHGSASNNHRPRWQKWAGTTEETKISDHEYWDQVEAYCGLAFEHAKKLPEAMLILAGEYDLLPNDTRQRLRDHLTTPVVRALAEEKRVDLWEALVLMAVKHRNFSDAGWAMSDAQISELELVAQGLVPTDPRLRHRRLFVSDYFNSLAFDSEDYEQREQQIAKARSEAVGEILAEHGLDALLQFAEKVGSADSVGIALADATDRTLDGATLVSLFADHLESTKVVFAGFVWRRAATDGWSWVDDRLSQLTDDEKALALLKCVRISDELLQRVERLPLATQSSYWSTVRVSGHERELDMTKAIQGLLDAKRPNAAINCVHGALYSKRAIETPTLCRCFDVLMESEEPLKEFHRHHFCSLLKRLQQSSDLTEAETKLLVRVEWEFVELLDSFSQARPMTLYRELASDPKLFSTMLAWIYHPKGVERDSQQPEPSDADRRRAKRTWSLFHDWNMPPGTKADGTFDGEALRNWVSEMERHTKVSGHHAVAMVHLGQVLTNAPKDENGLWIHAAAAAVLDGRNAEAARDGFCTQMFNNRGTHTWTAGAEEMQLAEQAKAKAVALDQAGYPRFGAALHRFAESYQSEAKREASRDPYERW